MITNQLKADKQSSDYYSIVLIDGVCHLCQWITRFIILRDPRHKFRFASIQSEFGQRLLDEKGYSADPLASFILIENGTIYTHSTGALRIARSLSFPWPLACVFIIVPRFIRDRVYRYIARNRYRWFGKDEQCLVPTPDMKDRFLSQ
ncbi:DCC1-like thiol-disulfide oxidoreductase family protein [Paenibacillus sediminis]|uniref:DCC family thiol-disulfide oxidoreductase YuxK n=1 Tax=Paenibacillus sediminis TaxID=664909 RepID=A0ABS4H4F9_9BACL|nr:putative DCC family thiol-disulfide oxidoreductase YuxK [Paenibacillus sediminis]